MAILLRGTPSTESTSLCRAFRGVTPPERPQHREIGAVTTSLNTPQTQVQSQSLRADSNRGPLHYESSVHDQPGPLTPANAAAGGRGGSPQDRRGHAKRPQNAPSSGRLAPGSRPAPARVPAGPVIRNEGAGLPAPATIAGAIQRARELNDRQADELVHRCRLHVTAAGCDASTFCTSYCGRKIPAEAGQDGPHCVVCDDLRARDSRTASR